MSRARNRHRGRGLSGSPSSALHGVTGFDGSNFFSTTSGVAGQAAGFWIARLFVITGQVGSATRLLGRTITGSAGWNLRTTSTNTSLTFLCIDGAVATKISPAYTVSASDVGKVMMAVGVHDGSAVRLYVGRAEIGSGTAITGYTAPSATERLGDICDQFKIFGGAGGHGAPSGAQVLAYFDKVKGLRRVTTMDGVQTDRVWVTDRAGTITDAVGGSATMTVTGSLTGTSQPAIWGW